MTDKNTMDKEKEENTKHLYTNIYKAEGHDYGGFAKDGQDEYRTNYLLNILKKYIHTLPEKEMNVVVEVGAGLGHLNVCHKNWMGFEYSTTAVELAKRIYGPQLNIFEADARDLPVASESVDFLFSFATLEHIPEVEKAFTEIERVLRGGGIALINPAWNCRTWTVKKLIQRPYSELSFRDKLGKFFIPLRNHLLFRLAASIPSRLLREAELLTGKPIVLDYKKMEPDFSLWDKYPHISDDDAFVSMDAHAALTYFASRKWEILSHPSTWSRLTCRGDEIVVRKPV